MNIDSLLYSQRTGLHAMRYTSLSISTVISIPLCNSICSSAQLEQSRRIIIMMVRQKRSIMFQPIERVFHSGTRIAAAVVICSILQALQI